MFPSLIKFHMNNIENDKSYSSESETSKKKGNIPWLPIAVGVGALFFLSSSDKATIPGLTQDDINLLNTPASELVPQIQSDTSPVIFQVSGTQMTAQERADALVKIDQYFGSRMDNLSALLMVDKDILTDAISACLAIEDGEVREKNLSLFLTMFEAWTKLFVNTALSVGSGIAGITAGTASAVANAKTCAKWTFVKKVTQVIDQTSQSVNSVRYTSSTTKIVFGILGSGSTAGSFHQSVNTNTMHEEVETSFVPHCTESVVDPDAVFAIMSAQTLAIRPLIDIMQLAIDMAPKVEMFVKTTP